MKTTTPVCSPKTDCNEMYKILQEAGCLVVRGVANQQTLNAVRSELSEYLDVAKVEDDDPNASYSGGTRRVIALMHRSPTARQLMIDPIVEQLGDQHLLKNCEKWQLNVSAALDVGPVARDQIPFRCLHRFTTFFPVAAAPMLHGNCYENDEGRAHFDRKGFP